MIIDAMLFAPDGKALCLSMAQSQSFQQPPLVDTWPRLPWSLGAKPVSAHNLPEDSYQVSLEDGGQKQQISHLADIGMFATFSPDGQWFVVVSRKGIVVMKPDGSQASQIANIPAYGSVNWVK